MHKKKNKKDNIHLRVSLAVNGDKKVSSVRKIFRYLYWLTKALKPIIHISQNTDFSRFNQFAVFLFTAFG